MISITYVTKIERKFSTIKSIQLSNLVYNKSTPIINKTEGNILIKHIVLVHVFWAQHAYGKYKCTLSYKISFLFISLIFMVIYFLFRCLFSKFEETNCY